MTYRSKGPVVFIYCKLNILHILYIITHVTIIKHLLTYLLIKSFFFFFFFLHFQYFAAFKLLILKQSLCCGFFCWKIYFNLCNLQIFFDYFVNCNGKRSRSLLFPFAFYPPPLFFPPQTTRLLWLKNNRISTRIIWYRYEIID